ncbi:MAG: PIN domain nuclease [Thermoprotei archaeon]|nr:MAG: PIN domain nuclease [Thermoprotei archaeon]
MRYLVDASALYPLVLKLRYRVAEHCELLRVLDLTLYEVGNVVWKEYRLGRISDLKAVASMFSEVLSWVGVDRVRPKEVKEVAKLAASRGMTFYDASYIYVAEGRGYKLVTLDSNLLERCACAVTLEQMLEELGVE